MKIPQLDSKIGWQFYLSTTEAEINSSSAPVMMDVASTWAGWAVSAVTSKFQKSQPDKPLAVATTTPTAANNSAPSTAPTITTTNANSSSTTATASSAKAAVPTNKAPVYDKETVDSDKETNWDSNDWGDMDVSSGSSNYKPALTSNYPPKLT